jgi:hypothetical protein
MSTAPATEEHSDTITTTFEFGDHTAVYRAEQDDLDEDAVRFGHTLMFVCEALEIAESADPDPAEHDIDALQGLVDDLGAAFYAGQQVHESPHYEAFLQRGPEALPEGLLEDVRADLAPIAAAFDVELGLPGDDPTAPDTGLADHLAGLTGWRGS